ncbi:hypothetical protein PTKIN_Ptkin13bG0011000 [Pterospermum kingtungense]
MNINQYLQSQPLVSTPLTLTLFHILGLKRQCVPSLKCTTFEALAAHTWRSWVRSLDFSPSLIVKLLFSVNVREKLIPKLPQGYYGNGFVLACAETAVTDLVSVNLHHGIKLIQQAKSCLTYGYVREGKPLHMGSLTSDIYCLFLPVVGNFDAVRVQVSVPECVVEKFDNYMKDGLGEEENGDINGLHNGEQNGFI